MIQSRWYKSFQTSFHKRKGKVLGNKSHKGSGFSKETGIHKILQRYTLISGSFRLLKHKKTKFEVDRKIFGVVKSKTKCNEILKDVMILNA